jgi:hypothetical protein
MREDKSPMNHCGDSKTSKEIKQLAMRAVEETQDMTIARNHVWKSVIVMQSTTVRSVNEYAGFSVDPHYLRA